MSIKAFGIVAFLTILLSFVGLGIGNPYAAYLGGIGLYAALDILAHIKGGK